MHGINKRLQSNGEEIFPDTGDLLRVESDTSTCLLSVHAQQENELFKRLLTIDQALLACLLITRRKWIRNETGTCFAMYSIAVGVELPALTTSTLTLDRCLSSFI